MAGRTASRICSADRWWSAFGLLQRNVLDRQRWHTREQLPIAIAIVTRIERTYRRRRRRTRVGRSTTKRSRPRQQPVRLPDHCHLIVRQPSFPGRLFPETQSPSSRFGSLLSSRHAGEGGYTTTDGNRRRCSTVSLIIST